MSIETISVEYCDDTLQPPPQLSAYIIVGEFKTIRADS